MYDAIANDKARRAVKTAHNRVNKVKAADPYAGSFYSSVARWGGYLADVVLDGPDTEVFVYDYRETYDNNDRECTRYLLVDGAFVIR